MELLETIKGWEIDSESESEHKIPKPMEPPLSKTQPSERQLRMTKKAFTPNRTPLPSVHEAHNKSYYIKKNLVINASPTRLLPQNPVAICRLRFPCHGSDNNQLIQQKAYSSSQLGSLLQLKRKNLYLQSILRKVYHPNEERYIKHYQSKNELLMLRNESVRQLKQVQQQLSPSGNKSQKHKACTPLRGVELRSRKIFVI